MRMNLSLFLTIYISSILFLLVFHIIFLALWYLGLISRVAGRRSEILTILQNCAVSIEDAIDDFFFTLQVLALVWMLVLIGIFFS